MPEFTIKGKYLGRKLANFFSRKNNIKLIEYYQFLVNETKKIPDEYFYQKKNKNRSFIWIAESVLRSQKIKKNFEKNKEYRFDIILYEDKKISFRVNNSNSLVLKDNNSFWKTVKKIANWKDNLFFYEHPENSPTKPKAENNNLPRRKNLGKIILIVLPILIFALLSFSLIKWISKKQSNMNRKKKIS